MAKAGARVHIYGDYDGTGVKKAQQDISNFGRQADGFSKSFKGSMAGAGAALGGAFGVGVIGANVLDFFQSSITAALADEKAMRSLEIALQNVGAAHQTGPIESFIDALARETGVADDQLRPAFQSLVTATGDVATSQSALSLAMDISAGTGRDLEAVSLALAKGFGGSTTALGKLGAGIDQNIIKSKDMDAITAALSNKFSGQASAAADTYQGKINKVSVAVGEASEQIGLALLQALDGVSQSMGGTNGAADTVTQLGNGFAGLISQIDAYIQFLTRADKATTDNTKANQYSQAAYREIVKLIPQFGLLLAGLSKQQESNTIAAANEANAVAVLTSRLTGLAGEYRHATGAAINFGRYQNAPDGFSVAAFYNVNISSQKALADAQNNVKTLTEDYNESLKKVGTSSAGAAKDTFTFKEALSQVNSEGLEKLNANLKKAQDEFDGFRDSVAGSLTGQLDFAGAVDAAKEGGTGIVDGISAQAGGIVAFGEQLLGLLQTTLSEESFAAVAALSAERGAALANELLGANGAALIAQLDSSVASVNAIADAVAVQSATKFKGAGVKTAEDTITGFKEYMGKDGLGRKRLMNVMDNLAEAATREVRIDVLVTRSVNEVVSRISSGTTSLTPMAAGGPVVGGRPYLIGEVGPELFIPSSSGSIVPNNEIGGGSNVYSITVNTGVGDPRVIGEEVVNVISRFEKANGAVFARA